MLKVFNSRCGGEMHRIAEIKCQTPSLVMYIVFEKLRHHVANPVCVARMNKIQKETPPVKNLTVPIRIVTFCAMLFSGWVNGASIVIPGEVLVSNLGSSTQPWDTLNRDPVATKFRIGNSDVLVTGIIIRMAAQTQAKDLTVRIASNGMDHINLFEEPDVTIGTFVTSPLTLFPTPQNFYFPSSIPIVLSAKSTYWVEVDGSDADFSAVGVWYGNNTGLMNSGVAGEALNERIRGSFTDSYNTGSISSFMAFELIGNVVPEPNFMLPSVAGLTAIMLLRLGRR